MRFHLCLSAYLETNSRIGLHDVPYIMHQLADAAADLLRANANDHALGSPILRLLCPFLVDKRLFLSLATSSCHFPGFFVWVWFGVFGCAYGRP